MSDQLTFDLPVRSALGREDFFVSSANTDAVTRLDEPENWVSNKLAVVGPIGSGKTHLLHVWAETNGARILHISDVISDVPSINCPVALDTDEIPVRFSGELEVALFHLHNRLAEARLPFLISSRVPPARWNVNLPDLKSRLAATDLIQISEPDDALLAAVYVKLFADRQIQVAPDTVTWMVQQNTRSFSAALKLVRALDAHALSEKRAITKSFARKVLDKLAENAP